MIANLNILPIDEKIQLVEDLWDSIAEEKSVLPITEEQKIELDSRLEAYAVMHGSRHPKKWQKRA